MCFLGVARRHYMLFICFALLGGWFSNQALPYTSRPLGQTEVSCRSSRDHSSNSLPLQQAHLQLCVSTSATRRPQWLARRCGKTSSSQQQPVGCDLPLSRTPCSGIGKCVRPFATALLPSQAPPVCVLQANLRLSANERFHLHSFPCTSCAHR